MLILCFILLIRSYTSLSIKIEVLHYQKEAGEMTKDFPSVVQQICSRINRYYWFNDIHYSDDYLNYAFMDHFRLSIINEIFKKMNPNAEESNKTQVYEKLCEEFKKSVVKCKLRIMKDHKKFGNQILAISKKSDPRVLHFFKTFRKKLDQKIASALLSLAYNVSNLPGKTKLSFKDVTNRRLTDLFAKFMSRFVNNLRDDVFKELEEFTGSYNGKFQDEKCGDTFPVHTNTISVYKNLWMENISRIISAIDKFEDEVNTLFDMGDDERISGYISLINYVENLQNPSKRKVNPAAKS